MVTRRRVPYTLGGVMSHPPGTQEQLDEALRLSAELARSVPRRGLVRAWRPVADDGVLLARLLREGLNGG